MNPVRFSLRYPQIAWALTAIVFIAGIQALLQMPRREDPKVPWRVSLIVAYYPGATAEQVEQQVTKPIEDRLFRFSEINRDKSFSTSMPGLAVLQVWVNENVKSPDLFWAKLRHDMNEAHFIDLPQGVLGPIVNSDFGDVSAMLLAVEGDNYGYRELAGYLDRIEDDLRSIPAISKIKRVGELEQEIRVTSTMDRLSQYGISPLQIIGALQQQNAITESGALDTRQDKVALRTSGLYDAEDQIRRQIVGISPRSGNPIYLSDFATVDRAYAEPKSMVRVNSQPALLLSLEIHEGRNIVEFGKEVRSHLDRLRATLPPDLKIVTVADQPRVVEHRVGHFLEEFGIAILSVIAVTMLLLPFRVAAIAATAIPVTVAATFAVMQALGIELHQVSLAGLIVVLGMVVDDAIVIADNFVELLDRGVERAEAAWRCAWDLAIPVLTATLTIIASFLPLAFLPGSTGDFIWTLPVTVAVALTCSYVVAMLLTPILCRMFIKEGLHTHDAAAPAAAPEPVRRFDILGQMQRAYDVSIGWAMGHRRLTIAGGVAAVVLGLGMYGLVDQQFFPTAERDQFVISVWMPSGSSLDATDRVMRVIEKELAGEDDVTDYAAFVGTGAPRFYYSFDPPFPMPNLGQFVVNTTSVEATVQLVRDLRQRLPGLVPAAEVRVQELQQGNPTDSPVEVRVAGPDLAELKMLAADLEDTLAATPGSYLVRNNYREDTYDVRVAVNTELASRLGMTSSGIAQLLAGTLLGAPVSTFWEGSHALPIVLRLDQSDRRSFDDVRDLYLVSPMTGARSPLRAVARLEPQWESGRIVRRNGIRTVTVGSYTTEGTLPSALLARVKPAIDSYKLPPGYSIKWGGELENQLETFGSMIIALAISLVAIFMILLFQFRRIKDVLVIMASIPLSLFGAILGLIITRNPFGFTAFLALIALSGIVVRNAIILLEAIHERQKEGVGLEEAALEAGQRRLRPIFLTTTAAAAGVLPMILSGSSMWSPLGSVIAVGLIFSMLFTLVVIPVLYILVNRGAPAAAHA